MIVHCDKCFDLFDDAKCWTICPHNPLERRHDAVLCREHDLFDCQLHKEVDTTKFAVLTRADLIQEVLGIWEKTVELEPQLRDEYEIAATWLTRTWTAAELCTLATLTVELDSVKFKPAWWKFWRADRETFREAWDDTKLLFGELRRVFRI